MIPNPFPRVTPLADYLESEWMHAGYAADVSHNEHTMPLPALLERRAGRAAARGSR